MNAKEDLFRMNALRLSAVVIEPQYLIQSERYIKNVKSKLFLSIKCVIFRPSLTKSMQFHAVLCWQESTCILLMLSLSENGLMRSKIS